MGKSRIYVFMESSEMDRAESIFDDKKVAKFLDKNMIYTWADFKRFIFKKGIERVQELIKNDVELDEET